ncbi:hypothetical protein D3C86_1098140 [compost metagenome]
MKRTTAVLPGVKPCPLKVTGVPGSPLSGSTEATVMTRLLPPACTQALVAVSKPTPPIGSRRSARHPSTMVRTLSKSASVSPSTGA